MAPRTRFRDAGGGLHTLVRARVRDAGNTLRTIQRIRVRDASNALRTVFQYLSVALNTTVVTGSNSGAASSGSVTSSTVTGTVSGGVAPYTYAWQYVSGDATVAANTPTAANTSFTNASVPDALPKIAEYQLQVTDNNGAVVVSELVEVQLYWVDTR
jgi:hypothetical protein